MRQHAVYSSFLSGPRRRSDLPGRDLALVTYLLFAAAFLLPVLAPVGVVLAYAGRSRADAAGRWSDGSPARTHFDRQIALFWRSVLVLLAVAVLHALVVGFGALTFGFGLVLMVLPWGLALCWGLWAAWEVGSGLLSAWRWEPV